MYPKFSAVAAALLLPFLLGCSDSDGDRRPDQAVPTDFSAANASLDAFVAGHPGFDGGSYIVVDKREGVIHTYATGTFTEDSIVMLASTSKMPAATLLMALAEDDNIDFEIDRVIDDYLPWEGVWTGRTTEQLLSNTSGIPGLGQLGGYGAHMCQYIPVGQLLDCAQTIYQTPLPGLVSTPPGTAFDYGGSQWQLAGGVAEVVGGASWNQLLHQYISEPCGLEVFEFGNTLATFDRWEGDPDGLLGRENPNIEGGAITNLADYAKILELHLNDGRCGDTQVLPPEAVAFMRIDRGWAAGRDPQGSGYGMGWWIVPAADGGEPTLFLDPGAFGAVSWIDLEREYAGLMLVQSATLPEGGDGSGFGTGELIPLIQAAYDAARP